ncbi:MAG: hypothetical protein QGG02_10790 [Gammaproteobacteria bacterium]|nr:hypothetical protein [Gammaproteobacteria bacterium]
MNRLFNRCHSLCLCVSLVLLPLAALSQDQVTLSNDVLRDIQRYQAQLEELESEFGPLDSSLLEPLGAIAVLLSRAGAYQQVAEIQTRQMALLRTSLGLEHPDLVPMVRAIIDNQRRLGNWQEISDRLEHIRFLQAANHGNESDEMFTAIENQAQWYQTRVAIDGSTSPAHNFMKAHELYEELEDLAEDRFGEDSPELIPWYYKRATSFSRMVSLLNSDERWSGRMLQEVIRADGTMRLEQYTPRGLSSNNFFFGNGRRTSVLNGDLLIGEAYLRDGLSLINKISDIAEQSANLEMEAMADLYHGDFYVLLNRGTGSRDYRKAHEKFLQAGISLQRLEAVFNRPMPIPMVDFFSSFSELEAYQAANLAQLQTNSTARTHVGTFTAWHEDARSILKPVTDDPLLRIDLAYEMVELNFRLSSRGKASSIKYVVERDATSVDREAYRALRDIRFRPAIIEGKPKRLRELQLRYLLFEG